MFIAATIVQSKIRSLRCQRDLLRRKDLARKNMEEAAATMVQAMVRSWQSQRKLSQMKLIAIHIKFNEKAIAATSIQAVFRAWTCQKELTDRQNRDHQVQIMLALKIAAATKIQSLVRSRRCQRAISLRKEHRNEIELKKKVSAATSIQARFRSWKCMKDVLQWRERAKQAETCLSAAIKIQAIVRSCSSQRLLFQRKEQRRESNAATAIQAAARSWRFRRHFPERIIGETMRSEFPTGGDDKCIPELSNSSAIVIQCIIQGYLVRNKLEVANKAAQIIQCAWRRCVFSLRMKLLQVFEFLSSRDLTHGNSMVPSPMKKARTLLPRDSRRLNRMRDITPQLPRYHECGVFVEEILNSVTVVIQSAARRYLVKQKMLKLHQAACCIQHVWIGFLRQRTLAGTLVLSLSGRTHNNIIEDAKMEKLKRMRFSTDEENEMLILSQIYQRAEANADAIHESFDSSACVSQYVNKFIHAKQQDTFISK